MKLYICKHCDTEVRFRDVKCPWCGRKVFLYGKRFTSAGWALYLGLSILALALMLIHLVR